MVEFSTVTTLQAASKRYVTHYTNIVSNASAIPHKQAATQVPVVLAESDMGSKVQAVLNRWEATHHGQSWGVVVRGTGNATWQATLNPGESFNADSLYKLFVAYLAYQKIDDGTYSLSQPYLHGWSRQRCLDEMIRNSDSPCAETWMNELGKSHIQSMVDNYGYRGTSIARFTTDATDVAALLARLQEGNDLSERAKELFMASMLGQRYRHGLPNGFAPWSVYDKVGFSGYSEYHDAGIVTLPDGQQIIVAMLTKGASSRLIAQLSAQIAAVL